MPRFAMRNMGKDWAVGTGSTSMTWKDLSAYDKWKEPSATVGLI